MAPEDSAWQAMPHFSKIGCIHVSDLPDFISEGYLFMFADDTTMYCIGKNLEDVTDQLNDAARELYEWCRKNQLTVHTGKTEAMIISHKNFTGPLSPIWFGTSIIKYVTQSTSLGITIDNKLSWDKQLTKITTSFNTKLKQLRRFRYLPKKSRKKYITNHCELDNLLYFSVGYVITMDIRRAGLATC